MNELNNISAKDASKSIPTALVNFDDLPNSQQVRLPVVKALLGVSSATVWRMVKAKRLKAHKLTERTTSFNVGELRALLAAKAA
jgi:predicted DNA-binding transcriptional regulator AlpA